MKTIVSERSAVAKGRVVDQPSLSQDQSLDLLAMREGQAQDQGSEDEDLSMVRTWLREAIDECRWKDAAVAVAIGLVGESGANYFSKMLRGEKPISAKHLRALPNDIEAAFARRYAEHFGLIVVRPLPPEEALKGLVAGLVSYLAVGVVKPRMVKAQLATEASVERRRA
jgi:hypothetical protein